MLKNTNVIGAISEAMVSGYLSSQGYEVFAPVQGHTRADMVYIGEKGLTKVQVKTATWSGSPNTPHRYEQCVIARTISAPYTAEEVDEFWIVGTHLWCFPFGILKDLISVSLGSTNPAPRKTVRTYDANDFIVVKGSLELPYRDRLFKDSPTPFSALTNTAYNPTTVRSMKYKNRNN